MLFVSSHVCRRKMRGRWRELKQIDSSTFSILQEALGAIRVVKAFGQEEREEERFVDRSQQTIAARLRVTYEQARYGFVVGMITSVGTAAVMLVGLKHVQDGSLSLGNLLLVMAYLSRLYEPLRTIGKKAGDLQNQLASAERALAVLDQPNEVP